MSYKLRIDTWKGYCTNDGETKFFANEEQFLEYLREKLGNDFADAITKNSIDDDNVGDLYNDIYFAVKDTDSMKTRNPVVMLKQYKGNYELLKECKEFFETEFSD